MTLVWPLTLEAIVTIALGAAVTLILLVRLAFYISRKRVLLSAAGQKMKEMCLRDIKDSIPHIIKPDLIEIESANHFFGVPKVKVILNVETAEDQKLIGNIVDACVEECLAETQWHNITTDKIYALKKRTGANVNGDQK